MGKHYEQLSSEERATIMKMKADGCSARQIARVLLSAPSSITRELARFGICSDRPALMTGTPAGCEARAAGLHARRVRFKRRKPSELATNIVLFVVVQHFLIQGSSPSQNAGALKRMCSHEPRRTVSHETIYTCIYAMPKGELRKDLIACMHGAKARRMPRSRGDMPDLQSIHVPQPKARDRALPGRWEGDLIKDTGNRSVVGVLVERSTRLVMLIKLANATAASVLEGFTAKLLSIAELMYLSLTYDQGKEMARHAELLNNRARDVYGFYPPIVIYQTMLDKLGQPNSLIRRP